MLERDCSYMALLFYHVGPMTSEGHHFVLTSI